MIVMHLVEWTCWQLIDSSFPSGGFAHSNGLEAARAHGLNAGELPEYLAVSLRSTAHSSGPFINAIYKRPESFIAIDQYCDTCLINQTANRASRRQGTSLLRAATEAFALSSLKSITADCRSERTPGHYAPLFGLICHTLNLPQAKAHEMFIFINGRAQLSAATRLGMLGPLEAQSMQHALRDAARQATDLALCLELDDITQTSPLLEIFQGTHDRLYSRLFQS